VNYHSLRIELAEAAGAIIVVGSALHFGIKSKRQPVMPLMIGSDPQPNPANLRVNFAGPEWSRC
jgi:hypothetical protein